MKRYFTLNSISLYLNLAVIALLLLMAPMVLNDYTAGCLLYYRRSIPVERIGTQGQGKKVRIAFL